MMMMAAPAFSWLCVLAGGRVGGFASGQACDKLAGIFRLAVDKGGSQAPPTNHLPTHPLATLSARPDRAHFKQKMPTNAAACK